MDDLLSAQELGKLREAGRIAAAARRLGHDAVSPGARLLDVCEAVEDEIRRRGGELAFPVQSSLNQVAAHYCPAPGEQTVFSSGDLAKLDIGVHVEGHVVDTAVTINVGDEPDSRFLVEATRSALDAALATAGPGVAIRQLAGTIEGVIRSHGLEPMRNLCGHGVGRWTVHCPPPIPNLVLPGDGGADACLTPGLVVAIEPFATAGRGLVTERGSPEVFRLASAEEASEGMDGGVLDSIHSLRGLPFARRHLRRHTPEAVERTLALLRQRGRLTSYAPLVETQGQLVSQAEHTLLVTGDGVEVLTR